VVLTPNKRMKGLIQNTVESLEPLSQAASPTLPLSNILPFALWIETLWQSYQALMPDDHYKLLSTTAEELIWEKIIAESESAVFLLKIAPTARLASDAWHLQVMWNIKVPIQQVSDWQHTEDSAAFLKWSEHYEQYCKEKKWVDRSTVIQHLITAFTNQCLPPPECCLLFGFQEITPLYQQLLTTLRLAGTLIQQVEVENHANECCTIAVKNPLEELTAAIQWAHYEKNFNKSAILGIVVPNLAAHRNHITRLMEVFFPQGGYNIAAPVALMHYPIISSALNALSLYMYLIDLKNLSSILLSPYFYLAEKEKEVRALLDWKLREQGILQSTLAHRIQTIEYFLEKLNLQSPFIACLKAVQLIVKDLPYKKDCKYWVQVITEILGVLGWPGERSLNSEEYQLQSQWAYLLEHYISLQAVLSEHSFANAVSCITRLAYQLTFLAQTKDATIQVLGLLEATGSPFDKLWVTGLHQDTWPEAPKPNPFIPTSLQREHGTPRGSAVRELMVAKRLTQLLKGSAKSVFFSHPLQIEDRRAAKSPLFKSLPELQWHELPAAKNAASHLPVAKIAPSFLETYIDNEGPPLKMSESVSGGTHIIKLQAACAFKAFAEIRLQAKSLKSPVLGLRPEQKGEIVHQIMQDFWQDLSGQSELNQLTTSQVQARVEDTIQTVLEQWQIKYPFILYPQYLELEKLRLIKIIMQWVALEKSRPSFMVRAHEHQEIVALSSLKLKIRIDRIDEVSEGYLILDYKTGYCTVKDWFGERIKEPQLPLYAISQNIPPTGVLFGMLHSDGVKMQGITATHQSLAGVKSIEHIKSVPPLSWDTQLGIWKAQLTQLSAEFVAGFAAINPRDGKDTCRFCKLSLLCRIKSTAK